MIPFTRYFEKGKTLWWQKSDKISSKDGNKRRGLITEGHGKAFGGDENILYFGCGGDYDYMG